MAFAFAIESLAASRSLLSSSSLRLQQMRIDNVRVERQRLLDRFFGGRRIHVDQRLRHADERGNPFVVGRERILKRLGRLGVVVHLQEQLAPARVQRRIVRRFFGGDAIRVVGELKFAQRAGGAAKARVLGGRRARTDLHVGNAARSRASDSSRRPIMS